MQTTRISLRVTEEYKSTVEERAEKEGLSLSDYIRQCVDDVHTRDTQRANSVHTGDTQGTNGVHTHKDGNIDIIIDQLAKKDEQIGKLQESLDQSQQLQAMTEKRYEAEHQQLIEMKARSFWQKLTSGFE